MEAIAEVHPGLPQTSKMESFSTIVNGFQHTLQVNFMLWYFIFNKIFLTFLNQEATTIECYGLKFIPTLFQPYSLQFHAHCLILLKMAIIEHYIRVSTVLPGKNLTNSPKYICYGVHFKENFGFNLATLIKIASTTDELQFLQVFFPQVEQVRVIFFRLVSEGFFQATKQTCYE